MPRRPAHPWFGPGGKAGSARPASREGWLVVLGFLVLLLGVVALNQAFGLPDALAVGVAAVLGVAFAAVVAVTYGASAR